MKKNFFLIVLTLVLVITVGYGAQNMKKHANLTALVLENVEALANDESGMVVILVITHSRQLTGSIQINILCIVTIVL